MARLDSVANPRQPYAACDGVTALAELNVETVANFGPWGAVLVLGMEISSRLIGESELESKHCRIVSKVWVSNRVAQGSTRAGG